MNTVSYRYFILEATKISLFCLLISGVFKLFDASNNELLIVFNMALMSAAATFSPEKKQLSHSMLGSAVMVVSIILGGLIGFYTPILSSVITIVYAGLAFLLPKNKITSYLFITGAVQFLIFSSLPFNYAHVQIYLIYGIVVIISFSVLTWLTNIKDNKPMQRSNGIKPDGAKINALIAVSALSLAWFISYILKRYSSISHLYWMGLTVMVVIQGAHPENVKTAVKRMIVNICGALAIVGLFNYIMPADFWINFLLLIAFLFLIFALGFSYMLRTLFIEMFILGLTHLLGSFHDVIAIDRVVLTITGGGLVIFTTLLYQYVLKNQ